MSFPRIKLGRVIIDTGYFIPLAAFILIVFFISPYRFSVDDGGYIVGAGWRMLQGESLYADYIYARPPLSPYINAALQWILPDSYQYLVMKTVSSGFVMAYSFLSVMLLAKVFPKIFEGVNLYYLIAISFVFNHFSYLHPWHTTDGIFFAVLGAYFLFKDEVLKSRALILASLFIGLSMLTKQSYYLLPLFAGMGVWYRYDWKKGFVVMVGSLAAFAIGLAAFALFTHADIGVFLTQKQYRSQLYPAFYSGFFIYFLTTILYLMAVGLPAIGFSYKRIVPLMNDYAHKRWARRWTTTIIRYSLFGIPIVFLVEAFFTETVYPLLNFMLHSSYALIIAWLILGPERRQILKRKKRAYGLVFFLLAIGWSAGLSWGMPTPLFFSSPIIIVLIYAHWSMTRKLMPQWFYPLFLASMLFSHYVSVRHGDAEHIHLGEVYPKLKGIYSDDPKIIDSFFYVTQHVEMCGDKSFTVLQSHTYINWLLDKPTYHSLDWISRAEAMDKRERVARELEKIECVVVPPNNRFTGSLRFGWGDDMNETTMKQSMANPANWF